jgi:hypothetical protein
MREIRRQGEGAPVVIAVRSDRGGVLFASCYAPQPVCPAGAAPVELSLLVSPRQTRGRGCIKLIQRSAMRSRSVTVEHDRSHDESGYL